MITDEVAPLRHGLEPWFMSGFEFRCIWEALGLDRLAVPAVLSPPRTEVHVRGGGRPRRRRWPG